MPKQYAKASERLSFAEVEELLNLALNTIKASEAGLAEKLGMSTGNIANWRKVGKAPNWFPWALKGLIAEHGPKDGNGPTTIVRTGMHFTTEQLYQLADALRSVQRTVDTKSVRAAIHFELASRLEADT
jgi:hypothetical protein